MLTPTLIAIGAIAACILLYRLVTRDSPESSQPDLSAGRQPERQQPSAQPSDILRMVQTPDDSDNRSGTESSSGLDDYVRGVDAMSPPPLPGSDTGHPAEPKWKSITRKTAAVAGSAAAAAGSAVAAATAPRAESGTTAAGRTWDNRRLFTEFNGILADNAEDTLKPVLPEELPLDEDEMVFGGLTPALSEMTPESEIRKESHRKDLTAAGYRSRSALMNLNSVRFVLAFLGMVIIGFWLLMAPAQLETYLLVGLIIVPLLAWALPPLIVRAKAADRVVDIERGLPDVMDMLNMGVSQGLTVPAALKRIGSEIGSAHPALADELGVVNQQAQVGSLTQALRNFSRRVDSPEVSAFTSLLIQSEQSGTSVSRALTEYSDSMRSTLRERADARANSASFKLLFPTALCLMPAVFLFLMGPAIIQMSNFFSNTAGELQQSRTTAIETLDQQPVVVDQQ